MEDDLAKLGPWRGRELTLDLPNLGPPNPGVAWFSEPETRPASDDEDLLVLGNNLSGVLFVLASDGSVHWVDDVELELGLVLFPGIDELVAELERQNGPSTSRRRNG